MRAVVVAIVFGLGVFWAGGAFARDLTAAQFRDRVIAEIHARAPNLRIALRDELGITLSDPSDHARSDWFANFDNAYAEYQRDPSALDAVLARYAQFAISLPRSQHDPQFVIAVLRPRTMLEEVGSYRGADGQALELVWLPFAGDLIQILAFDSDQSIEMASEDTLKEAGLTVDQAWLAAQENLPTRMGEPQGEALPDFPSFILISTTGGLGPSALLDPDLCQHEPVEHAIYLVVSRDHFLIVDPSVKGAEDGLRRIVEAHQTVSETPLACSSGHLQVMRSLAAH
ncbi:MAG: hypothetical protein ABUS57_08985 [Pseudomonadota bacterium]